jgi:hypothetical protein
MRFGEWRGRWLDQGFDDPKITADAFRVAYAKLTSAHAGDAH